MTEFLQTFEEFPPRQKAASFTIDQAVEKLRGDDHGRAAEPMAELSLWTDGATRSAITDFVAGVTDEGGGLRRARRRG